MKTDKPTNPKEAFGNDKSTTSVVSKPVIHEIALGMTEGGCKYGAHNYRVLGVKASTYIDAAQRHMDQWWEGEDIDTYSGIHHISKAMSSLCVLRDAIINGKMTDDRPPASPPGWMDEMNAKAKAVMDKFPEKVDRFTEGGEVEKDEQSQYTAKPGGVIFYQERGDSWLS